MRSSSRRVTSPVVNMIVKCQRSGGTGSFCRAHSSSIIVVMRPATAGTCEASWKIRGLLGDRFKLVMRVAHKTMPVYALIVASGGWKFQKSTIAEKDCVFDSGTAESCHHFIAGRGHPLHARAITMDDLARYIENWAGLPVVNRTTVNGLFAVQTDGWTPMRLPPPPPGNAPAARFDDLPTIFTALRTLGLELRQQEGTVPVYTVEHIERPAAE